MGFAESGLTKTNALANKRGVSLHTELVDLNEASWENNKWDEVVCIFGHFQSELRKKTLEGVKEAVKPGGYFLAEVYSIHQLPYNSGGPKDLEFLYTPEEFMRTFEDWRIVLLFMGEVIRNEGELHKGLSHAIQFAAQ